MGVMEEWIFLLTFGLNMSWWDGRVDLTPQIWMDHVMMTSRVDLTPHIWVEHVMMEWYSGSYSSHYFGGICHGGMLKWILLQTTQFYYHLRIRIEHWDSKHRQY